jgi:hypothetical protein
MKKLSIEIVVLFAVVAASFLLLEIGFKNYTTKVDFIFKKIDNNIAKKNIFYLGNSHAGALGDSFLTKRAINISNAGMNPYQMKELLQYLYEKTTDSNLIICNIDYDFLGKKESSESADLQFYKFTKNLPDNSFGTRLLASSNFFRSGQDYSYLLNRSQNTAEQNFKPISKGLMNIEKECKEKAAELGTFTFDENKIPENELLLKPVLNKITISKHTLLIITTPKRACFNSNYAALNGYVKGKPALYKFVQSINASYLDLTTSNEFTDADFLDYDHLSAEGTLKTQKLIQQYLAKNNN